MALSREEIRQMAWKIADEYGVNPSLFDRLIRQESNYNPQAVSKAGAQGLGQLMPGTAKDLGVRDPFNPEENLRGSARYLQQQLQRFGGREDLALAAYNSGPGNVIKAGNRVPNIAETQSYVQAILGGQGSPSSWFARQVTAASRDGAQERGFTAQAPGAEGIAALRVMPEEGLGAVEDVTVAATGQPETPPQVQPWWLLLGEAPPVQTAQAEPPRAQQDWAMLLFG